MAADAQMEKVKQQIFQQRIRLKEFFRDYDGLRSNYITKNNFVRALVANKIDLNVGDIETIANCYLNDEGKVNYVQFCEDANGVFVTPHLETQPLRVVERPGECIVNEFVPVQFEGEKEKEIATLLYKVALLCQTRGIVLKYSYKDFDVANRGVVSRTQFLRALPFAELNDVQKHLLADRYTSVGPDGRCDVNYRCLHEDISDIDQHKPDTIPMTKSAVSGGPTATQIKNMWTRDALVIEQVLQAKVFERQLRIRDYFKDYDPLKKGMCTCEKVRAVLTLLGVEIQQAEFDELVSKYAMPDGMFNWGALVAVLEDSSIQAYEEHCGPLRNCIVLTDQEHAYCDEVEELVNAKTTKERINLKPQFEDFDRCHQGHVSKEQFHRAMSCFGYQLSTDDVDMLCLRYCDLGNDHDFNYVAFLNSCNQKTFTGRANQEELKV